LSFFFLTICLMFFRGLGLRACLLSLCCAVLALRSHFPVTRIFYSHPLPVVPLVNPNANLVPPLGQSVFLGNFLFPSWPEMALKTTHSLSFAPPVFPKTSPPFLLPFSSNAVRHWSPHPLFQLAPLNLTHDVANCG